MPYLFHVNEPIAPPVYKARDVASITLIYISTMIFLIAAVARSTYDRDECEIDRKIDVFIGIEHSASYISISSTQFVAQNSSF